MSLFDLASVLVILAAFFSFLNTKFLSLPAAVAMLLAGLTASAGVLLFEQLFPALGWGTLLHDAARGIDFPQFLMRGVLSFLLFAGALELDFEALLADKRPVLLLASLGVLLCAGLVGLAAFAIFQALGNPLSLVHCLLFGALIAPTDPVAVLAAMKKSGLASHLRVKIEGESLFNDGASVVLFAALLAASLGPWEGAGPAMGTVAKVLLREGLGGLVLGLGAGWTVYQAMKRINEPHVELLMSLGLVMGIGLSAGRLHVSAPLAAVAAGLVIGHHGRRYAMTEPTRRALDMVWPFIDSLLNALLFLLIGLQALAIPFLAANLWAALWLIPAVLLARFASVGFSLRLLGLGGFPPGSMLFMTWGGLRGGLSIAMALSLPAFTGRDAILQATYVSVLFSILVQGLTIGPLIRKSGLKA